MHAYTYSSRDPNPNTACSWRRSSNSTMLNPIPLHILVRSQWCPSERRPDPDYRALDTTTMVLDTTAITTGPDPDPDYRRRSMGTTITPWFGRCSPRGQISDPCRALSGRSLLLTISLTLTLTLCL